MLERGSFANCATDCWDDTVNAGEEMGWCVALDFKKNWRIRKPPAFRALLSTRRRRAYIR